MPLFRTRQYALASIHGMRVSTSVGSDTPPSHGLVGDLLAQLPGRLHQEIEVRRGFGLEPALFGVVALELHLCLRGGQCLTHGPGRNPRVERVLGGLPPGLWPEN
jgi:hypothetical protein